jgi:hypothetical protein
MRQIGARQHPAVSVERLQVGRAIEQIDEEDQPEADPERGERSEVDAEQPVEER